MRTRGGYALFVRWCFRSHGRTAGGRGDGRRRRPEIAFRRARVTSARSFSHTATRPRPVPGAFGQRYRCLALDLPGHGRSAPASNHSIYSLPGYAATLAAFARALAAEDAVIVGWSLGGHTAIETAPSLPEAAGFLISGTPPVASAAQMAEE